jgi:hypothetical protein
MDSSNPEAFSQNNPERVESKVKVAYCKHTFPGGEISAFEQGVLKDAFNTAESRNDVHTIIIKLPQFTIMALRRPPEWITISITLAITTRKVDSKLTASIIGTVSNQCARANHDHRPN